MIGVYYREPGNTIRFAVLHGDAGPKLGRRSFSMPVYMRFVARRDDFDRPNKRSLFNRSRSSFSFSFSRSDENENDYENDTDLGSFGCAMKRDL